MLFCRPLVWIALVGVIARQPDLSEARRLQNEGDYPRAIALLESYLRENPDDAEGGTLLAWLYVQTGEQDRAVETYRSLLSGHADEADLHNGLGAPLFKNRELETAVSLDPSLVMAHYNLGLLRFEQGELEGAARSFERAIELDPKKPNYHFSLARAYRASYEFAKAAAAFRAGLALSPPTDVSRPVRLELALTLKHAGLFADAEDVLRNLLASDVRDAEALFRLRRLYLASAAYT